MRRPRPLRAFLSLLGILVVLFAPGTPIQHGLLHLQDAAAQGPTPEAHRAMASHAIAKFPGFPPSSVQLAHEDHPALHCEGTAKESRSPILAHPAAHAAQETAFLVGAVTRPPFCTVKMPLPARAALPGLPRAPPAA